MFELLRDMLAPEVVLPGRVGESAICAALEGVNRKLSAEAARARAEEERRRAEALKAEREWPQNIAVRGHTRIETSGLDRFYRPHTRPNLKARHLSFPAMLIKLVREKCDGVGKVAYTRAGVSRQIYSRIISWEDSRADKNTVMRFCIGLQLTLDEARKLMEAAGFAFSASIPLDCVVEYAIEHQIWNLDDIKEILRRVNTRLTI